VAKKPLKDAKGKSTKKEKSEDTPEPSKKKRRVGDDKAVSPVKEKVVREAQPQGRENEQKEQKKQKAPAASEAPSSPQAKKVAGPPPSIKNIARSATSRAKAALAQSRKAISS
jgi:hypothetical protein